MTSMHLNLRHLAVLLFAIVMPLNTFFLIRTFPTFFLQGVGGCRQVRAPPDVKFHIQTCICIIGASNGLGHDMARTLSERGGNVKLILTGRTPERAQRAVTEMKNVVLAAGMDLEDEASITRFEHELRQIVRKECHGKLDYLFMNAGQIYADNYDEAFHSKDGQYDRLFSSNFLGYVKLLKDLHKDLLLETRVIYVGSVAHYTGLQQDVLVPNAKAKNGTLEQMVAYHTSKLALVTLQQILAKDGKVPNSIAVTCGSVATLIDVRPSDRDTVRRHDHDVESPFPKIFRNTFQLTSQEGAEVVLNSAFLPEKEVRVGEFVLPYFFGFTDTLYMKKAPHKLKVLLNIWYEQFLQRMTYKKGYLWVCPASMESRDEKFQELVKQRYLTSW